MGSDLVLILILTNPIPGDRIHKSLNGGGKMSKHNNHKSIITRLKRAKGHLDHVIEMMETEKPCVEVAQQMHAVSNAIINAKQVFINEHIEHCFNEDSLNDSENVKNIIEEFKEITKYLK